MKRFHNLRAGLAAAALALAGAGSAQAADVAAAAFFSACPGPVYVSADTNLTGKATVSGNCTVSVDNGIAFSLTKAKVTFASGYLYVWGNGTVTLTGSTLTASDSLVLDGYAPLHIDRSKVIAGTSITVPPRDGMIIAGSDLTSGTSMSLGGQGGVVTINGSDLVAGTTLNVAPGFQGASGTPTDLQILDSGLFATEQITIGGAGSETIIDSTMEALGSSTAIELVTGGSTARLVQGSKFEAPSGRIVVGGNQVMTIENSSIESDGALGTSSYASTIVLSNSSSLTLTKVKLKAANGNVLIGNGSSLAITDGKFEAGGATTEGFGIVIGSGGNKTIADTKIRTHTGSIEVASGTIDLTDSKLRADGAQTNYDSSLTGIQISGGGPRTIAGSSLTAALGRIDVRGSGLTTILDSKLVAKNEQGIVVSCAGSADVSDTSFRTLGNVSVPNGQSANLSDCKITVGETFDFLMATGANGGGNSTLVNSSVKGGDITVQSFGMTTATDNKFKAEGLVELSSTGTCTSTDNNPDVPCL